VYCVSSRSSSSSGELKSRSDTRSLFADLDLENYLLGISQADKDLLSYYKKRIGTCMCISVCVCVCVCV